MQEVPIDVVAFVLTAISILVVYHLFSMDAWTSAVSNVIQEARNVAAQPSLSHFDKAESAASLKRVNWRFPIIQTVLLFSAVTALTAINIVAARRMNIDQAFTIAPTIILDSVIVIATIATAASGTYRIQQALKLIK